MDELKQWNLRRYGAGDESSFVYCHAKRGIKQVCTIPVCCICPSWM
ncbi:DUF4400 domain-containing protein [Xenorhabdus budapestensis]|nr:DUF4400 domain-containing protein [Xenorhabdus budapestensis]